MSALSFHAKIDLFWSSYKAQPHDKYTLMILHRYAFLKPQQQYPSKWHLACREYPPFCALPPKQEFVKDNRDLITWVSQQIKSGATITDNLANLYNRAAGRSDEISYDELYDLINKALPDKELYM